MSLFDFSQKEQKPLSDRMRPRTLDEFLGQEHLLGPGKLLRRAIEVDQLSSSIFYGPPGCGKTTLAHIISLSTKAAFFKLNAVTSGVAEVREVIKNAADRKKMYGQNTYLLLDECHRWNKAQSDSILPAIEDGTIRFIGSTTENPMISMTPAIVSRCRIFEFVRLKDSDVLKMLKIALIDAERGLGALNAAADEEALLHLVRVASGDVRTALNALELAVLSTPIGENGIHIDLRIAEDSIQKPVIRCDESLFYDMLSAFCKSLRGSDSDAALLWFSRLLYAGADPKLLARRIIAHASEDVGMACPEALVQAVSAAKALEVVGMPEARLALAQAIIFICESPKSNSVYLAMTKAKLDAEKGALGEVPSYLRDASYSGANRLERQGNYLYPHDYPEHWIRQNYMPEGFENTVYYTPGNLGYEENHLKQKDRPKGGKS